MFTEGQNVKNLFRRVSTWGKENIHVLGSSPGVFCSGDTVGIVDSQMLRGQCFLGDCLTSSVFQDRWIIYLLIESHLGHKHIIDWSFRTCSVRTFFFPYTGGKTVVTYWPSVMLVVSQCSHTDHLATFRLCGWQGF